MSLLRRFTPQLPQISVETPDRFEGWYFKVCTSEGKSCAFIPGISTARSDPHAFIQYIDGRNGNSHYERFPIEEFSWTREPFSVSVGCYRFGADGIFADSRDRNAWLAGQVSFGPWCPYPAGFLRPGIMGPFGFAGFLECYHAVVSANHSLQGELEIRLPGVPAQTWRLNEGKGYIEKDWGHSFPRDYVWMQANSFERNDLSVFVSLAAVPFKGRDFPGIIAFVRQENLGFVTLATWNGAKVTRMNVDGTDYQVTLRRGPWELFVAARQTGASPLQAPAAGQMDRVIKETVDGHLECTLTRGGRFVAGGSSRGAGLELGGNPNRLAQWFTAVL
ncbi:MAG: hypothetical protein JXP39_07950 [Spirochaetales bacterium]|nr:hypothetical protein [Spirochaetales bacterium]